MQENCPIYHVVSFVGKRWTVLVMCELNKGRKKWKRYSDIKRKLPKMTPKMLSARFKELQAEGLLKHRVDAKTFPIKSEYKLTDKGEDFIKVIMDMKKWALKWKVRNEHCETVNCKYCDL
jgi:DNA-binding HxlR family transcriptional regulator